MANSSIPSVHSMAGLGVASDHVPDPTEKLK